ncbi:MAG TPA: hypothetical protein VF228_17360 [Iamia sp.]
MTTVDVVKGPHGPQIYAGGVIDPARPDKLMIWEPDQIDRIIAAAEEARRQLGNPGPEPATTTEYRVVNSEGGPLPLMAATSDPATVDYYRANVEAHPWLVLQSRRVTEWEDIEP